MATAQIKTPTSRVNALLKKAGYEMKMIRGRGYYYMIDTGEKSDCAGAPSTSLYVCWLDRTEADFQLALSHVNDVLRSINFATI